MTEFPQFDDVGSFPLPENIDIEWFNQFYWVAYKAIARNNVQDIFEHDGINNNFIVPMLKSFQLKMNAGVEIINYPQHIDMYNQFLKPIEEYEKSPGLIDSKMARIPEMFVIDHFAKENYEKTGKAVKLKICVTGPIELYVKKHGFTVYSDLALNYAKSINSFVKNSIINNNHLKTEIVSIDEPSFGYIEMFNLNEDEIVKIFDKSLEGVKTTNQIHLHTLSKASTALKCKNINVLTCEYASDPKNKIEKQLLVEFDKYIRVGITRTNLDNIIAENLDSGKSLDEFKSLTGKLSLIDSKEQIKENLTRAIGLYGDRLKYIGPDCGLGGWQIPQIAFELLHRTSEVIEEFKNNL